MKLFVTGAAGFIGSNYVRWVLANSDDEVTILDALTYAGNMATIRDLVDDRRCHVRPRRHLRPGRGAVVDGRPRRRGPLRRRDARRPLDQGRLLVRAHQLLRHERAVRRRPAASASQQFVHISTDEVYGSHRGRLVHRDRHRSRRARRTRRRRPAATSSRSATSPPTGCRCVVTRCSNNFGPYQFPEKVIPLFTTNLLDGKKVPLYGDGGNVRDWIHVHDHNTRGAPRAAAGHAGRGLQHRRRQRDHQQGAHLPAARAHRSRRVVHRARRGPQGPRPPLLDHTRQGHRARLAAREHTLDDGLAATVEWYRDNREWWEPLKAKAAF